MIYINNNTDPQMVSIPRAAVAPSSSVTEYATEEYVDNAIAEAISGITGVSYEAGENIEISGNVISVTGMPDTSEFVTSGDVETQINDAISGITGSTGITYEAGDNIQISGSVISVTGITSYTGITSEEIITALGYTPCKVTAVTEEYYTNLQTKDDNTIYGIIE